MKICCSTRHWISIVAIAALGVICAGVLIAVRGGGGQDASLRRVQVTRGSVVRNAAAVGRIEVEHEIAVKSLTAGILSRLFVKPGQKVAEGDPLAEVRPVATTMSLIQAERALEAARDTEESAREFVEGRHMAAILTRLAIGAKNLDRRHRAASVMLQQAKEQLELIRNGEAVVERRNIDYVVRAPASGHVLERNVREGDPVVAASSYGSGTVLMTLADMDHLVFRGTVDEIDVGRLKEGLPARVKIGALPGKAVAGKLVEIALKAWERNNAVVFGVRIELEVTGSLVLRSGYSAVAEIEVDRRENVLVLPERVVEFRGGEAFVQVPDGRGGGAEKQVETGLSDGLTVEIVAGLAEGQRVLEKTYE